MELNQYITIAVAVLINEKDELLTVRKKESNYYQLPGGKIEMGERPVDCLRRELKEELDLNLSDEDCRFVGLHEAQAVNEAGKTVRGYVFECRCAFLNKDLKPQAELSEILWLNKEQVGNTQLANLLRQFALPIWLENGLK